MFGPTGATEATEPTDNNTSPPLSKGGLGGIVYIGFDSLATSTNGKSAPHCLFCLSSLREALLFKGGFGWIVNISGGPSATSTRKKAHQRRAKFRVEVAGVEPASKQGTRKLSTRLVTVSSFSSHPAGNSLTRSPASKIYHDDRGTHRAISK